MKVTKYIGVVLDVCSCFEMSFQCSSKMSLTPRDHPRLLRMNPEDPLRRLPVVHEPEEEIRDVTTSGQPPTKEGNAHEDVIVHFEEVSVVHRAGGGESQAF